MGTAADRRTGSVEDVVLVDSIADPTSPTATEINAGVRLECFMIGGLERPRTGNSADVSSNCERDNYSVPAGIDNGPCVATMYRHDDGTDAAWVACDDTANPPVTKFLVVATFGFPTGTAASGDNVDVYTVQQSSRNPEQTDKAQGIRFVATWDVQDVEFDVTVAA